MLHLEVEAFVTVMGVIKHDQVLLHMIMIDKDRVLGNAIFSLLRHLRVYHTYSITSAFKGTN